MFLTWTVPLSWQYGCDNVPSPHLSLCVAGFTVSSADYRDKEDMYDEIIRLKKVKSYQINVVMMEHIVHQGVSCRKVGKKSIGDFSVSVTWCVHLGLLKWPWAKHWLPTCPCVMFCSWLRLSFLCGIHFFPRRVKVYFDLSPQDFNIHPLYIELFLLCLSWSVITHWCCSLQSLQAQKSDNQQMKAKLRRLEEDNTKREKQIEELLDPTKVGSLNSFFVI